MQKPMPTAQGHSVMKSTQDKRHFFAGFSVRHGGKRVNFELTLAEDYGGQAGLVRVRKERRWLNTPDNEPRFFDKASLGALIAAEALGFVCAMPQKPDLHVHQRVSVHSADDRLPLGGWTTTEPILDYSGLWKIGVTTADGSYFVNCDAVSRVQTKRGA